MAEKTLHKPKLFTAPPQPTRYLPREEEETQDLTDETGKIKELEAALDPEPPTPAP